MGIALSVSVMKSEASHVASGFRNVLIYKKKACCWHPVVHFCLNDVYSILFLKWSCDAQAKCGWLSTCVCFMCYLNLMFLITWMIFELQKLTYKMQPNFLVLVNVFAFNTGLQHLQINVLVQSVFLFRRLTIRCENF